MRGNAYSGCDAARNRYSAAGLPRPRGFIRPVPQYIAGGDTPCLFGFVKRSGAFGDHLLQMGIEIFRVPDRFDPFGADNAEEYVVAGYGVPENQHG